jgi:hypothetical protein
MPELTAGQKMYDALERIAKGYMDPDPLRARCERLGADYESSLELSYQYALDEAKQAIKGMRRP